MTLGSAFEIRRFRFLLYNWLPCYKRRTNAVRTCASQLIAIACYIRVETRLVEDVVAGRGHGVFVRRSIHGIIADQAFGFIPPLNRRHAWIGLEYKIREFMDAFSMLKLYGKWLYEQTKC